MLRMTGLIALTLALLPATAHAQGNAAPVKKPAISAEEKLDARAEEMMKGMDENQIRQFATIRTAHGTIRAVEDVRDSLGRAVKSCGKANPDMAAPMTERFQAWKNAVMPVMRQGQNRLEKMILTQSFTRPSAVRAYLKSFDDVIKASKAGYTEVPVSDKAACEALNENMDQSQHVMGRLISETLGLDKDIKTKE